MEAFPKDYVDHNLPLICLSGIGHDEQAASEPERRSGSLLKDGGFKIRTDVPPLTDAAAEIVLRAFLNFDSSNDTLNTAAASTRNSPGAFKIKTVGRVGQTLHGPALRCRRRLTPRMGRLTLYLLVKHHLSRMRLDSVLYRTVIALRLR